MKQQVQAVKLQLFCRFNGDFHTKPPYNELCYVGGETEVITVEKNVSFLQLVMKICQFSLNLKSFCVKYKLVWCDSDSEKEPPLVSIECDDDVKCMVEEFDEEVELFGDDLRIWLFVDKKSGFCGRNVNGSECGLGFDFPLYDFSSELSDECCGNGKVSGKLSIDERLGEYHFNPRDEYSISERNEFVLCVSWQSNVECNGGNNLQCEAAYSVDLLYSLSLSSSKEVESPVLSSLVCNGASNTLLKSEVRPPNLIDDGKLRTSPKAAKPGAITSDYVSQGGLNIEKDCMPEEEIQQDPPSGLIVDEQVETKESIKGSNVIGGISNDQAAFYTHLAAKELQAIKYSDLEFIKELASGTYGTVYHGKCKGSDIAIKKLKPSSFASGSVEKDRQVADFWREAYILGQLHHPNIVAFNGVVTDGPANNLAMVTEYMVNGSLRQVLKRKDRTIDRRKRLIIAMDAAIGMEYLHEKNIVHFDLKSHNLLVNMKDPQRPICKIGDLGLSKIKNGTLVSGGMRGTIPWMAPELLNNKNMVTEKVDVYSFGVVMWELLTGEEPYANLLTSEGIIDGIIKGNLRPEIPSWIDPTWRSLMVRCWSSNPDERPAFSEIAKELRAMAVAMNIK